MRRALAVAVAFALFFFSTVASADFRIPKGKRLELKGVTYECFDLEAYKRLLLFEGAVDAVGEQVKQAHIAFRDYELQLKAINEQLDFLGDSYKAVRDDRDRVTKALALTGAELAKEKAEPRWGSAIAWALAAAGLTVSGIFVLVFSLRR